MIIMSNSKVRKLLECRNTILKYSIEFIKIIVGNLNIKDRDAYC